LSPRFGTDGIRGVANSELTPEIALSLGRAAARVLPEGPFLIGRDTRLSGPLLQAALSAGLSAEGRDVVDLGVIPTPGVAWTARERQCPAAVISASHNPYRDNGIKLFSSGGSKLSVELEGAVEAELEAVLAGGPGTPDPEKVGELTRDTQALGRYAEALAGFFTGEALEKKVLVDCANGAAYEAADLVFSRLGIEHEILFADPDGRNINAGCGSTHPQVLQREVVKRGAALGIALDGDADRMLAVDEEGNLVDGDHLIALFAGDMQRAGELEGETVVVTVMSNLGLHQALSERGLKTIETPPGDRHVADALEAGGYVLGGEQSGHIIFWRHSPTGDGLLTAVKLLGLLGREKQPLGKLASSAMSRLPQVLLNVPVPDTRLLEGAERVWEETEVVREELASSGRVLLRSSGTESCVRVMVEATSEETAHAMAERLARVVRHELS
jgi:phosphoglucosamine mutase